MLPMTPVMFGNPHIRIRAAIISHRPIISATSAAALTITAVNENVYEQHSAPGVAFCTRVLKIWKR